MLPAFGLACLMALTFGVTAEAIRRGPLGAVSPITALSPGLTAVLALLALREHVGLAAYAGIALAPAGIVVLSLGRTREMANAVGSYWPLPRSSFKVWEPLSPSSLSRPRVLQRFS